MKCECAECAEYGGPNPTIMRFRLLVLGAQFLLGVLGLISERSFKALAVQLGALAFFLTLPRYLICCRCEGYGGNCYSLYLGRLTSLYLPKVEGKEPSPIGAGMEALTLGVLANAPAVGLRKNRKLQALYLLLANITLVMQVWHACRHCAANATDWKRECPGVRLAGFLFKDRDAGSGCSCPSS